MKGGLGVNAPRRPIDLSPLEVARFWSKVDKSAGPGECWPWTGAKHTHGYGMFSPSGKRRVAAHRASFTLSHRPLDGVEVVRHICDNPPCVNPAHLIAGSQADNVRDQFKRGRLNTDGLAFGRGTANGAKKCPSCGKFSR